MTRSPPINILNSQLNNKLNNKLLINKNQSRPNNNNNNNFNVKNLKKVKSTIQIIKSRNLKSLTNKPITGKKTKLTTTSQSRHSDPFPIKSNLLYSPRHKLLQPQPHQQGQLGQGQGQRKSLPNLTLAVPNKTINRISITNPRRTNYLTTSDEEGPPLPQEVNDHSRGGRGEEEDSEEDSEEEGEEGEEGEGGSSDSSLEDSSDSDLDEGGGGISVQLNDGYETVDPAYVTKKLRELKRGPLLHKHELESQEITLAFESSIARSKVLFVGFLGGEITEELINASEEIEAILRAGVRMFEGKKVKYLDRVERDSEKIDQMILKFSVLSKKLISSRQQLSINLETSRESIDRELNTLKKNYESNCKSIQQPHSKSKSNRTSTTTGGGGGTRKSRN